MDVHHEVFCGTSFGQCPGPSSQLAAGAGPRDGRGVTPQVGGGGGGGAGSAPTGGARGQVPGREDVRRRAIPVEAGPIEVPSAGPAVSLPTGGAAGRALGPPTSGVLPLEFEEPEEAPTGAALPVGPEERAELPQTLPLAGDASPLTALPLLAGLMSLWAGLFLRRFLRA